MARTFRLCCEALEIRLAPALNFLFDYRFDTHGFFNDPMRRDALERAGAEIGSRLDSQHQAIVPTGGNTWAASFFNPANGLQTEVPNLTVPAGTIVVFAGGRNFAGSVAGEGGAGGYRAAGSVDWFNTIARRGQTGFSVWGGSIAFDTDQPWYFGADPAGVSPATVDFHTIATHELGHLLGLGASAAFDQYISGRTFTGPHARAANGGIAPSLSADLSHWAQGTTSDGRAASLQPYLVLGQRYGFSSLDYAALADIGWTVTSGVPTVPIITPPPAGTTPATPPVIDRLLEPIVLSGTSDGLAYTVRYQNGAFVSDGVAVRPFADYFGEIRSATADVNGDGVTDIIYATGPGGPSRFTIVDGATGLALITPQVVYGNDFTGGLFLATADLDRDGRGDIIISPDQGGGGRVVAYRFSAGAVTRIADFWGIEDVNFRGGARIAAADLNNDGTPDLVVGAGFGGGPRIALFDGRSIHQPRPQKFIGDFFAFPGDAATKLRNGVYVAAGDINGDGRDDLIVGAGPGGGPQVYALDMARLLQGDVAGAQARPLVSFFAFSTADRGGVRVAVHDVDRDGNLDLVAGSGASGTVAWYKSFDQFQRQTYEPAAFTRTGDGIYVGPCQCRLCQIAAAMSDPVEC